MDHFKQTRVIGYQTQVYSETRTPSEDASNVARWVITPSVTAFFFGVALFGGLALSGAASSTFGFTAGMGAAGGGLTGIMILLVRSVTFDKQPAVSIRETTPIPMELPEQEQAIGGNRPVMVPTANNHEVEHRGHKYNFSPRQCRLMIDRIEDGNWTVARDAFEIESTSYSDVRYIMQGRGYWTENGRGVEWTGEGAAWLKEQMRVINI